MDWYRLRNESEIPSPALVIHAERLERNLARMVAIAGDPARLWPHVKTHKVAELVAMQVALGIRRFKCATIAEAEMVAGVDGVERVLLAVQPVGPQVERLHDLADRFREVHFAAVVDDPGVVQDLSRTGAGSWRRWGPDGPLDLYIDLDVGQHRTGTSPKDAEALAHQIAGTPELRLAGLHAYDGHLGIPDPTERKSLCDASYVPVDRLRRTLEGQLGRELEAIAGGSPTFAIHAARDHVSLSPGTTVFWDAGYAAKLPDLPFEPAAVLLCRVVSRPGPNRLCVDLGHKAVASEMPQPRMVFLDLADVTAVSHSEEHLVIESPDAARHPVGSVLHAIPWHVCPTVALHSELWIERGGVATERWEVLARARKLTV
jgi:D-serine deaminase-like pyridoxal phosphate-dependent protein